MPTFTLDPVTLLLIAVIAGGVLLLLTRAVRAWRLAARRADRRRSTYTTVFFNGQTFILPGGVYDELIEIMLPEGRNLTMDVQDQLLDGKQVRERDIGRANWYIADALNRLLFEKPGYAVFFTEEGQADLRRRIARSRG